MEISPVPWPIGTRSINTSTTVRLLLNQSREHAKAKLAGSANMWAACTGPATSLIATLTRIGWTIHGADLITTDIGTQLNLRLDSPQAVKKEVHEAVRRWRWRLSYLCVCVCEVWMILM